MKIKAVVLSLTLAAAPVTLLGQFAGSSSSLMTEDTNAEGGFRPVASVNEPSIGMAPFSRVAFGGGISALGVNLQAATNLNRHSNFAIFR